MPLVAGKDADLRGVADAGGHFARQDRGDELIATGLVRNEGRGGHELPATGEQGDGVWKFQRTGAAAGLVVDEAIALICTRKTEPLGATLEATGIPTAE